MGETRYTEETGRAVAETTTAPEHDPIAKDDLDMPSSKSTKFAAFQFYPRDFLTSDKVARMSLTEVGIYITLLSYAWLGNGLPSDLTALAKLVRMPLTRFQKLWAGVLSECFVQKSSKLVNPRQEQQRKDLQEYVANCQRGGEQSAKTRRAKFGSAQPPKPPRSDLEVTPNTSSASSIASSSASSKEHVRREERHTVPAEKSDPPLDVWFRELKAAYPDSAVSSGHLTETAFVDAVLSKGTPAVTFTVMLGNLANQKQGHQWRVKGMIPRLDRWLREGLWEQQHEEAPPAGEQLSPRTLRMLGGA